MDSDRVLPFDLLFCLIDISPLATVNSLMRTCRAATSYAVVAGFRAKNYRVADTGPTHSCRIYPNGMRHGLARKSISFTESSFFGELTHKYTLQTTYSGGQPTTWMVESNIGMLTRNISIGAFGDDFAVTISTGYVPLVYDFLITHYHSPRMHYESTFSLGLTEAKGTLSLKFKSVRADRGTDLIDQFYNVKGARCVYDAAILLSDRTSSKVDRAQVEIVLRFCREYSFRRRAEICPVGAAPCMLAFCLPVEAYQQLYEWIYERRSAQK